MSGIYSVKGIVVKEVKVGEADKIVHILTDGLGLVSASCKGAMRVRSRLVSSTSLLAYSSFSLYQGKSMYTVDDARIEVQFWNLRQDVVKLSLAMYFLELVRKLAPDETDLRGHLKLVLNTLYFLDNGKRDISYLKPLFELRLLSMSGYMPDLVGCARCGQFVDQGMYFSPQSGDLICRECHLPVDDSHYTLLGSGLLAAMRHIIYSDFSRLFNFRVDAATLATLEKLAEQYLIYQTDGRFKALDFYKGLV